MIVHYLNESYGTTYKSYSFTIDTSDFLYEIIDGYVKYVLRIADKSEQLDALTDIVDKFYENYENDADKQIIPDEIKISYDAKYSYDDGDYDNAPWSELEISDVTADRMHDIISAFKKYTPDVNAAKYVEECVDGFLEELCEKDADEQYDLTYDDDPDPDDYYDRMRLGE